MDRVQIQRSKSTAFDILDREKGTAVNAGTISSGETELISLAIEVLAFAKECEIGRTNILLIDEPDVHLHPDLQDRFARFLANTVSEHPLQAIVATHSTSLLSGLAQENGAQVAFMKRGDLALHFQPITNVARSILPIFGAHPLSNVFNQIPVLLVEGEDDERVWQQAVRSSNGGICVYPCVVDGTPNFGEFERETQKLLEAVYDNASAFSLRDRDEGSQEISDLGPIKRMKLACRTAENLMLSDDCLQLAGSSWNELRPKITEWRDSHVQHDFFTSVQSFIEGGFDRKSHDLKLIRNILISLISEKPWEVLVGQAIARLVREGGSDGDGSLREFLGIDVCTHLLKLN